MGAFVIFNTLSITVAQRTRELATLRTIGASRRQVLRSVLVESLVIGAAGLGGRARPRLRAGQGADALFEALGLDLPQASTVFATRTVVVSLLVGVVVTVLAGLAPAVRATRVAPIAAVREGATPPAGRFAPPGAVRRRRGGHRRSRAPAARLLGSGLGIAGVILASLLGILLLFVGVALLGSASRPSAGGSRRLAVREARRRPAARAGERSTKSGPDGRDGGRADDRPRARHGGRDHGRAAISSSENAGREQIGSTHVLGSEDGWSVISTGAAGAVAGAPGVEAITSVRYDAGEVQGRRVDVGGIEPATIDGLYRFDWAAGSSAAALGSLGRDGAIVREDLADKEDIAVGDRFAMLTPAGKTVHLTVRGIYEPPRIDSLLGTS